jgi:putative transposase
MGVTAACDIFTVSTATLRNLWVFVVLSHDRRLIRRVAVTTYPTAQWTAEQVARAFPEQRAEMLRRDNDAIYGNDFFEAIRDLAIKELSDT